MYTYFKIFNSIKDYHEVELARLELESLVGPVVPVRNAADLLKKHPFSEFTDAVQVSKRGDESDSVRFQDYLTHESAYGRVQGFESTQVRPDDIPRLVRRLGYTREIYVVDEADSWKSLLRRIFPQGALGKNCHAFQVGHTALIRIITNQYFLENSEHITRVTQSLPRERMREFVDSMFDNLIRHTYRIPASERARVGKRLLDYFAERGECSLYLSHGMHPYKGKFHPKMARALINLVWPRDEGIVMDNFAGSGTLLVEASLMGLDSCGSEINPMSVLMANAKCALLRVDPASLDEAASAFVSALQRELKVLKTLSQGQDTLDTPAYPLDQSIIDGIRETAPDVYDEFSTNDVLSEMVVARLIVERIFKGDIQNIMRLALAMCISNLKGKKTKNFAEEVVRVVEDICRRALLFNQINSTLGIRVGHGRVYEVDASDLKPISDIHEIRGNVNSPPYSTALDYIANDLAQLVI
ncbi:MAG: hypothetical protein QXS20_06280, partial [Candidatus Thorarchaeota archaeon]